MRDLGDDIPEFLSVRGGGSGNVTISSPRECTWTVSSDTSWILADRTNGQGEASLPLRVAANSTPNPRRGALTVESTRLELAQDGAPCRFDLDTTRVEVPAAGGGGRFVVTAMSGCTWTARTLDAWIDITGGGSASGSGTA